MSKLVERYPWLPSAAQWCSLAILVADAAWSAYMEAYLLLAFVAFFLGSVLTSMAVSRVVARMSAVRDEMLEVTARAEASRALADTAARTFQEAINAGRVEVVPVPPPDWADRGTFH